MQHTPRSGSLAWDSLLQAPGRKPYVAWLSGIGTPRLERLDLDIIECRANGVSDTPPLLVGKVCGLTIAWDVDMIFHHDFQPTAIQQTKKHRT